MERFAEVIVGASLQALDALVPLVARGQHDDWHHHAGGAPPPQDFESRQARQAQVEHDDVVLLGRAEKLASLAVGRTIDRVPARWRSLSSVERTTRRLRSTAAASRSIVGRLVIAVIASPRMSEFTTHAGT